MAKTEDFDFEDFDFDNFGAEGDAGFDGKPPKDDRKPSTRIVGSFTEGASDFVKDPSNQIKFIRQALPPGYSQTIGSVEKTLSNARSLYDTALREAGPAIKEGKKIAKTLLPSVKGVLPKGFAEKLEKWSEDVGSSSSDFNPEENEITMSLGSIFAKYQEANQEETQKASAEQAARDYAQAKQTGDSIKQLVGIHNYAGRLVAYQDQVAAKFQQKSLELQYRHYFTARKTLEVLQQQLEFNKVSIADIAKNTALPEVVKYHNSEVAKDMMKRKFLGKVTEPLSQWFGGVGSRVMMKARGDITGFFKDLGTQLGDFSGLMHEAQEMGGNDLGSMGGDLAGQMAGGAVMNKLSVKLANKIRSMPGMNGTKITAIGQFLERMQIEAPERFNKFLKDSAGSGGLKGWAADYVRSAGGDWTRSTEVQGNTSKDLEQKMYFDFQTRQTIVEVIPKWLSMIHNELEISRRIAGGESAATASKIEAKTWDWEESRIVERKYIKDKLKTKFMDKADAERTNKDLRKVMDIVDKGEEDLATGVVTFKLSASVRQKLFNYAHRQARDGKTFDLELLVSPAALANPKLIGMNSLAEVEELQTYLKTADTFGYDTQFDNPAKWNADGTQIKGAIKNLMGISGPFKNGKQGLLLKITKSMSNVQRNMKNKMAEALEEAGKSSENTQMMTEMKLLNREKDSYHLNDEIFDNEVRDFNSPDTPRFRASGGMISHNDNPLRELVQQFSKGGKPSAVGKAQGQGSKATRRKGLMSGPGTTTSDEIPAYVSDKEFIVRAQSVRLPGVLPLLQFINSLGNKPDMAPGEMVGANSDGGTANRRLEEMVANNWQFTNDTLKAMLESISTFGDKPIVTINLPDLPNFDLKSIDFKKLNLSTAEHAVLKIFNSGKNAAGFLGHNAKELAKWSGKNAWELGKGTFNFGKGLVTAGGGVVKNWWEGVEGFYAEGKAKILLRISDLEIEDYIDTNTQKVIKKLSDITGEVKDSTGRVIISAEDYAKGIYYGRGKQVLAWLSEAKDTAVRGVKGMWNLAAVVPKTAASAYNFLVDAIEAPDDVYVEGDTPWEPRLRKHLFKQNHYRVKASGDIVKRVSQLSEPIVDIKGNVLIDEDDLRRGLVDFDHQPIKGLKQKLRDFGQNAFTRALNIGKKIATTAQDIVFGLMGNIKNFFTGSSWGISLFSSTQTVVTRLEQIWHLLNKRLKGPKQATPKDFGGHAKITIEPNADMSADAKRQVKEAAKRAADGAKQAAGEVVDKVKASDVANSAKGWYDKAVGEMERRKQEWRDNNDYNDYLKRTASQNPTREDDDGVTDVPESESRPEPTLVGSAVDNFKKLLTSAGRAEVIGNNKTMLLGYLKSNSVYQTIFENENLTEDAKKKLVERVEKLKARLPDLPSLPADVQAKLKKLSELVDSEQRPQSLKRYLDYMDEVSTKYGGKAKDKASGVKGWFKGLFSKAKEPEAPRVRSSDMDDLVQAQQSANPQPAPAGGDLLSAIQENHANGRELGIFKQLFSMFRRKPKPASNAGTDEVIDFGNTSDEDLARILGLSNVNLVHPNRQPKAPSKWNRLKGWMGGKATELGEDRTRIADAFRSGSGLQDWGRGTATENAKGFFKFDLENLFRSDESMAKVKAAKEAKAQTKAEKSETKRLQAEWDTRYFQIYTQMQSGEISQVAHDAWLQHNPSPEQIKRQAILDAKTAAAAAKQKEKLDIKQSKDKFHAEQAQWDTTHGQIYGQFASGNMTRDEYDAWLAANPSPKDRRKQSLSKLSFKDKMGRMIKGDYRDADGDGDRDGSAEDQNSEREKKKKDGLWAKFMTGFKDGKEKGLGVTKEGIFDTLKKGLGGLMSVLGPFGKLIWGLKNILVGTMTAVARVAGFAVKAYNMMKGIPALLGRGIGAAAKLGRAVISNPVTKMLAKGAGRVAGIGARILTGPVGWALAAGTAIDYATGGAISSAIGKTWNAVYDYYNAKSSVIAKYRMAQYGYDVDDQEHMKKIIMLEDLVAKNTEITSTGQAGLKPGLAAEECMKIFNVDTKKEDQVNRWVEWFVKRFKPVYLSHATMMYVMVKKIDVPKADDLIPAKKKVEYLNAVHFVGDNNPYTVKASPFPDEDEVKISNGWISDAVDNVYDSVIRWAKDNAASADLDAARKRQEQLKRGDKLPPPPPDNSLLGKAKSKANEMKDNVLWAFNHFSKDMNVIGTDHSLAEGGAAIGGAVFDAVQKAKNAWSKYSNKIEYEHGGDRKKNFFAVLEAAKRAGDPHPEIVAAQWALESSWGKNESGKFNFFGIKAQKGEPGTTVTTHEVLDGKRVKMPDKFKDYGSIEEGIADRVNFMVKNPRYIQAGYFDAKTPYEAALALRKGVYATDDSYPAVLSNVLKGAGLDPFAPSSGDRSIIPRPVTNKTPTAAKPTTTPATATKAAAIVPVVAGAAAGSKTANPMVVPVAASVTPTNTTPSANPTPAGATAATPASSASAYSLYRGEPKYIELGKRSYKTESGVVMQLDPVFADRVYAAFGEYFEKTKKIVVVTSCYRDYAKQADLYRAFLARNKREPLVAAPGKSKHERGLAIDISSEQGNEMDKMGLLKKNGIIRPLKDHPKYKEEWHLEMAGGQPTKAEDSDTNNYIQPTVTAVPLTPAQQATPTPAPTTASASSPTAVPLVTPVSAPVAAPETKQPLITNPSDKAVVQSRNSTEQNQAALETQKRASALDSAKGIDGAVEVLRQQYRLQEQMRDSLVSLNESSLRVEKILMSMSFTTAPTPASPTPNATRPNIKTVTDTRQPPVSVSRQT